MESFHKDHTTTFSKLELVFNSTTSMNNVMYWPFMTIFIANAGGVWEEFSSQAPLHVNKKHNDLQGGTREAG